MNSGITQSQAEAEIWYARRMESGAVGTEEAEFEAWHQNPRNAAAYRLAEKTWQGLAPLQGSSRLLAAVDLSRDGFRWQRWLSASKPMLLAAGIAAIALLSFQWFADKPHLQTFTTAIGEQRTEVLQDGSQIILNTNTAIDITYTRRGRELTLRSGEAIFDVKGDARRPFVVTAGRGETTALGTRFQMRNEQKLVVVTLLEGSVGILRFGNPRKKILVPGQQAMYSDDFGGISTRNVDVSSLDSWTRGRLEFRFTPLMQVVEESNRYSIVKLRISDPFLNGIPVSGSFRAGDMAGIAVALEGAYPLKAEYGKEEISLTPR